MHAGIRSARFIAAAGVIGALALAALADKGRPLAPTPASAGGATIVVNTLEDAIFGPDCSLRMAISNANSDEAALPQCDSGAGADTIVFEVSGTIELVGDLFPITNPAGLTIEGGGVVTVSGIDAHRPFRVEEGASLTLENLTVTGGLAGNGGGIYNKGTLTLNNSTVSGSEATGDGGGIYNDGGEVTLTGSAVSANEAANGGGFWNEDGILALSDSEIISNTVTFEGGGFYNDDGEVSFEGSIVSGNSAGVDGGGFLNKEGNITLKDGEIMGNTAASNGGGIYTYFSDVMLISTTVSGNGAGGNGGGIHNNGVFTLSNSVVSDNDAHSSGGIQNSGGSLTLVSSTISANSAVGATGATGGIRNGAGSLTAINSTISDNTSEWQNGGIANGGPMTLVNSTVSGNSAVADGGGIVNWDSLTLVNSTISGNSAGNTGGGLLNDFGGEGEMTLINSTVTANAAGGPGGGIQNPNGVVTLTNTLVADQQSGADCEGPLTSGGHNLDSDDTCGLTEDSDVPNGDANLGPLDDNGGPTLTHALLEGSDAIDAGDDAVCQDEPVNGVDQRGGFRPAGEACDIGAFEFGAVIPLWGDIDCDGAVVIGDALKTARYLLGLSVSQEPGCPEPGADVTVDGIERIWGDVDCDDSVAIGDALKIARWLLELSVSQEEGCPEIGAEVFIG